MADAETKTASEMEEIQLGDLKVRTINQAMRVAIDRARRAAESDASILILGESGVGKEIFARFIHETSRRSRGPFVPVCCPAIPETLFESELFGHEKGAFTGAVREKRGKFELADGGTLFLDEIGDMSPSAQAKLLRAIETREIDRVGGERAIRVNVRLIAATNQNLAERIVDGRFRQDLYYRLNEILIEIPPLRSRPEDIRLMAEQFAVDFALEEGKRVKKLSDAAMRALVSYDWPGNVRELRSVIRRAVALADPARDMLWIEDLGMRLTFEDPKTRPQQDDLSIEGMERKHIEMVLKLTGFNKSRAAELLKISRPTLDKKIKDYAIEVMK